MLICGFSCTAFCQANAKPETIRELMKLSGAGNLGETFAKNMLKAFKDIYPNVETSVWDEFAKEIKGEEMVNLVIPIYAKYFTEEDMKDMIAFYKSPVGKKLVEKQPLIVQESMQAGQVLGREIGERVTKKLQEKGLIKTN